MLPQVLKYSRTENFDVLQVYVRYPGADAGSGSSQRAKRQKQIFHVEFPVLLIQVEENQFLQGIVQVQESVAHHSRYGFVVLILDIIIDIRILYVKWERSGQLLQELDKCCWTGAAKIERKVSYM
jgi:hypothetical protein